MRKRTLLLFLSTLLILLVVGAWQLTGSQLHKSQADTKGAVRFQMDAWADNWFAAYLGETLLVEDSVPITTERSFNAETVTFKADYPLHLNFVLKVVAVTNANWTCTVIHTAPLDPACAKETKPVAGVAPCTFRALAEPTGWKRMGFDDSQWKATTIHSADAVSPKGGYGQIKWDANAQFIWGPDLKADNTVLCRVTVNEPKK